MKIQKFEFPGVFEVTPRLFRDARGIFQVTYNERFFKENKLPTHFVQDNESFSVKGTLRGLHFQKAPHAQGKLVRVIQGKVQDVIVDLRQGSPTFKQWKSFIVSSQERNILFVPAGFAHGFLALEDSIFSYKCTGLYEKSAECGVRWDDPTLDIKWDLESLGGCEVVVSEKDKILPSLEGALEELSPLLTHSETCTFDKEKGWGHVCFCGANQFKY
jgi:dTDP-4-dehydrorhamnose 3,5-epimerase